MIYTWNLDPVAFYILGHPIRWYGIGYMVGFLVVLAWVWYQIKYFRQHKDPLTKKTGKRYFAHYHEWESFAFIIFLVGLIGGRLSHFLFFNPQPLLQDWTEIFRVWNGGMAIQGGFFASIVASFYLTGKNKIHAWPLADSVSAPLAFAFGLGRLGNFMNGELVGQPTNGNWGVIFPHIDQIPRHAPVLYEFGMYFLIALVITILFFRWKSRPTGILFPIFIMAASLGRFFIEYTKTSPLDVGPFTSGQILCLFLIAFGLFLGWYLLQDENRKILDKN